MDNHVIAKVQFLQRQAASLLLYQSVVSGKVGLAFLQLLHSIRYNDADGRDCMLAYGNYFQSLANINQNWEEYLIDRILKADNAFSQESQKLDFVNLSPALIAAAQQDLQMLQSLHDCSSATLSEWVQSVARLQISPVVWYVESETFPESLVEKFRVCEDWGDLVEDLAAYYRQHGTGLFAQYHALRWQGKFIGIEHADPVKLNSLVGYEQQKQALIKNTEFLLSGQVALHVLLYGSRGSGKSSLVKALLNEYGQHHLRIVEVGKSYLEDLPEIVEKLRYVPHKFIIFVDDLSFEDDDDAFKALKVVLEGNLTARSPNVVVYATSNRRHLVREFFGDRPSPQANDEVHAWDTMQEKLSFSDRFGLTLTFTPASQKTYLEIVRHLADQAKINLTPKDLEYQALQWATQHNGRSGRTARQFIDFLSSETLSSQSDDNTTN